MSTGLSARAVGLAIVLAWVPSSARALPEATTLLAGLGFTADQIAQVEAGQFVTAEIASSSPRELVASFAFEVSVPPAKLADDLRAGLLVKVDSNISSSGVIEGAGSAADFAALSLTPDTEKRLAAYASGSSDLNLSPDEIAAFQKLTGAAAVEQQARAALSARVQAYRAKGLAGIAPYARGGRDLRSPADELRSASSASKGLEKHAPAAYALLLGYPAGKPAGFQEVFRWTQFDAHGVPTIALTHSFFVPDGDALIGVQRQFYVNTGYNAEQAIAALVPTSSGTVVIYANRTSTDQITGFGGSAKRTIGSHILESQLQSIFEKLRKIAK